MKIKKNESYCFMVFKINICSYWDKIKFLMKRVFKKVFYLDEIICM